MKNIFFTLCTFLFLYGTISAQYCGGSGPSVCDTVNLSAPGFSPPTDSLAPLVNSQANTTIINFKNYDTIPGLGAVMHTLVIDSITNLPNGICWAISDTNNTFGNQQNGCIRLSGTPNATPGQYRIHIYVVINGVFPTDLVLQGLKYFIRVRNTSDTITPVDTTCNVDFRAYGPNFNCTTAGVNDIESTISSVVLYPNPMNSATQVKFHSGKTTEMTERITNILGGEVHKVIREVRAGSNSFTVDRNNLPAGVYFYSLTDGPNVITKRMIISD